MKLKPKLKERIIGASLYGAFIFLSFGWNKFSFLTGVFILLVLAIAEALRMDTCFKEKKPSKQYILGTYGITLLVSGFMLASSLSLSFQHLTKGLIFLGIVHHIYLFLAYAQNRLAFYRKWPAALWIGLYIGISIGSLYTYSIVLFEYEIANVFHVLLCVWVTDIGAYFTGSSIGKHKFAPSVSPNKTWEGVIGGVILALVFSYIFGSFAGINLKDALVVGLIISATTVFGDLSESGLKRVSGIKDTGQLIPGHGGVLDRIDGYLYVQPFIALYYISF